MVSGSRRDTVYVSHSSGISSLTAVTCIICVIYICINVQFAGYDYRGLLQYFLPQQTPVHQLLVKGKDLYYEKSVACEGLY